MQPSRMNPSPRGAMFMANTADRVAKDYRPPSPLPTLMEKMPSSIPGRTPRRGAGAEAGGREGIGTSHVDLLISQIDSVLDGDKARVRDKKVERSVAIHRRRMEDIRDYERRKVEPPIPPWKIATEQHHGPQPLKSIDEWLGQAGPRIRGRNNRELEKIPAIESYYPRQMESASQYDSELRANLMVKNASKYREIEQQVNEIYCRARPETGKLELNKPKPRSYPADEVMAKLTAGALEQVHAKFKALCVCRSLQVCVCGGGQMNSVEFVEVMSAHLPCHDWEDYEFMVRNILEVYKRLDIDDDGTVSWDEMFEFTIEMGRSMSNKNADNLDHVILDYKRFDVHDTRGEQPAERTGGIKDCEIERLESLALMDRIAVLEKDSPIVKLYDAETLELTDCLIGHKGAAMRCMHLEGTDYVVSSATDACLMFWGAYTNTLRQILPCKAVFMSLVWDALHNTLYAGATNGYIYCFHIPNQTSATLTSQIKEFERFEAHKGVVTDMLAVRDLGLLISASMDSKIHVFDIASHKCTRKLHGHAQGVYMLSYIPSQRYLISAGFDHNCKVWNPMITETLFTLRGHNNTVCGLRAVLGSNRIVTADVDGVVKIWDTRNFVCSQTLSIDQAEPGCVSGITYVARMDRIVVACVGLTSRRVHRMICLDYEHPSAPEFAEEGPVVSALISTINNLIITASMRTVRLWAACTGLLIRSFKDITPANITALCLDSREQRMVLGDESGTIGVYNCMNGTLLKKLDPHSKEGAHLTTDGFAVCALAYCPYSKCIVSASWGGRVRVHHDIKPDATKILRQVDGHATSITCMAYSVKLSTVATSSSAGSVRLWDFHDVKLSATLQAHTTEITLVYWLDEYRLLLTGDFLGNLILWSVPPWREKYKSIVRWEFIVNMDDRKSRASSAVSVISSGRRLVRGAGSAGSDLDLNVKMSLLLPMSVAEFDEGKQQLFNRSIASVAGSPVSKVILKTIEPSTRHIKLDVEVACGGPLLPPVAPRAAIIAAEHVANMLTLDKINGEFKTVGLPKAEILSAPQVSTDAKRDTPTCAVFHAESDTIFIGGASGEIVAYYLKAVKGALLDLMGVDDTGRRPGGKLPPVAPRMTVRNPREGKTKVPESISANAMMGESIIKSSGDITFDINKCLDWPKDFNTGELVTPRFDSDIVRRKLAWTAHQDSVKNIQIIQVLQYDPS